MSQKKIQKLFQTAGIYTITNICNSAIPFLLLPVFTRYLTPLDYGIVATFQILISFIAPFVGLSISGAISVKYYDKSDTDLPKYITNCICILFCSTFCTSIIIWLFAKNISSFVTFPIEWLWSIVLVSMGQFLIQITLALWQVQMKPVAYGAFQILQTIFNISLSLVLIIIVGMEWQGRLIAQVICDGSFGVIAIFILYKNNWLKFEYDRSYIVSATKFGVPLIPHAMAGWAMSAVDRVFINRMVGIADTGIYTVAYQVVLIIQLIEMSFNNAWVPWFFHNLGIGDYLVKRKIVIITYVYVSLMVLFALFLSFAAPWFMNIFVGNEFHGSIQFIFWLALGKGIYSMYFMTCNYLFYTKRTVLLALSTFSSAVIHILATYILVKNHGAIGAAQAGIISTSVLVCMTWYFSNRVYAMPWDLRKQEYV